MELDGGTDKRLWVQYDPAHKKLLGLKEAALGVRGFYEEK